MRKYGSLGFLLHVYGLLAKSKLFCSLIIHVYPNILYNGIVIIVDMLKVIIRFTVVYTHQHMQYGILSSCIVIIIHKLLCFLHNLVFFFVNIHYYLFRNFKFVYMCDDQRFLY